jgi:hypothetical protein
MHLLVVLEITGRGTGPGTAAHWEVSSAHMGSGQLTCHHALLVAPTRGRHWFTITCHYLPCMAVRHTTHSPWLHKGPPGCLPSQDSHQHQHKHQHKHKHPELAPATSYKCQPLMGSIQLPQAS